MNCIGRFRGVGNVREPAAAMGWAEVYVYPVTARVRLATVRKAADNAGEGFAATIR
jgi:hypothetical protein